ncbi:MAG: alpha/beta hydrolase [Acidimicrobiales bacterium]|nr:alpha/beta hydrolase [Acidimicrobiales bacterium]
MADSSTKYKEAETAFLASEGVRAEEIVVSLENLGGTVRLLVSGKGPPVLFVPGVMSTGAVFAGLVGRLAGFRCFMLDRPGTGLSSLPHETPTDLPRQKRFADELLAEVLDALDLERAHVVSTSLGGWFTFRSAAAHPDRFISITGLAFQGGARVVDAPLSMRLPAPAWLLPKRPKLTKGMVRAMVKSAGMRGAFENGKISDEMLLWMVALLRYTDTFGNDSTYNPRPIGLRRPTEAVRHPADLLAKVTVPVHLFWGSDDLFGGQDSAEEFAGQLPNASLQMVERAGHAPWLDEPELAAAALLGHLTS